MFSISTDLAISFLSREIKNYSINDRKMVV